MRDDKQKFVNPFQLNPKLNSNLEIVFAVYKSLLLATICPLETKMYVLTRSEFTKATAWSSAAQLVCSHILSLYFQSVNTICQNGVMNIFIEHLLSFTMVGNCNSYTPFQSTNCISSSWGAIIEHSIHHKSTKYSSFEEVTNERRITVKYNHF